MAHWTTGELRLLKALHADGVRRSRPAIYALLPRHTALAVSAKMNSLGLWQPAKPKTANLRIYWLRVAHEHFARREAGLLA